MEIQGIITIVVLLLAGIMLYILGCCLQEKKNFPITRFEPRPLDEISTVVLGLHMKMNNQSKVPPPSYDEIMKNSTDLNKEPPTYLESMEIRCPVHIV